MARAVKERSMMTSLVYAESTLGAGRRCPPLLLALGVVAVVRAVVGLLAHQAVLGGVAVGRCDTLEPLFGRRGLRYVGGLLEGLFVDILARLHAAHRHTFGRHALGENR